MAAEDTREGHFAPFDESDEEELIARFGGVAAESAHPLLPHGLPPDEVPGAPLTKEQRQLIDEEDFYRTLFATNRTAPEVQDKYVTLVDVFRERETFKVQRFLFCSVYLRCNVGCNHSHFFVACFSLVPLCWCMFFFLRHCNSYIDL